MQDKHLSNARFIPVYTGNIFNYRERYLSNPVYPCVYREHCSSFSHLSVASGLSLCIQGTFDVLGEGQIKGRFIPVYTGNIAHAH